jgi:hypothetical protein
MMKTRKLRILRRSSPRVQTFLLLLTATMAAQTAKPPPPPADDWKGTNFVTAQSASVAAKGDAFDPSIHAAITPAGMVCSDILNSAIYRQDVLHAFDATVHFDNCVFENSLDYVDALVADARTKIAGLRNLAGTADLPLPFRDAMLAFGQALHAVQDFYAHSNYVELMQSRFPLVTNETDIPIVEIWTPAGRKHLLGLTAAGLYSGRVWWSLPHRCVPDIPTHAELAKDSPAMPAGARLSIFKHPLTGREISNHVFAFNLASRATREFLRWAAQNRPELEKLCGPTLKYIVQADRRAAN